MSFYVSGAATSLTKNSRPKTLLSVAVGLALGVIASPHVFAADNTALKIYGRANVSVDFLDNGDDSDFNLSSNSSRIGVAGSTEIVDGIKGILQIESQINYDNGKGDWASRDTFVGLEGDFGRVRLGQIDTPLKQIRSAVDFFGDQVGDLRNLTRLHTNTGAPYAGQDFDARFKNGLYYNTPSFGGLVWNIHYTPEVKEAVNLDDESAAYSTSFTYNTTNLYLALAFEQSEATDDSNAVRFGARYVAGDWVFGGLVQQATIKNVAGPSNEKVETYGAGASVKVAPKVQLKAQVYQLDADTDEAGATLAAIGADYILSKQLRFTLAYAHTDNEEAAKYRVTGGGGFGDAIETETAGEAATGLSLAVRYDF